MDSEQNIKETIDVLFYTTRNMNNLRLKLGVSDVILKIIITEEQINVLIFKLFQYFPLFASSLLISFLLAEFIFNIGIQVIKGINSK